MKKDFNSPRAQHTPVMQAQQQFSLLKSTKIEDEIKNEKNAIFISFNTLKQKISFCNDLPTLKSLKYEIDRIIENKLNK